MALSEAARKLRNEKLREWRKKNPEKMKLYAERYWEKRARLAEEEKSRGTK